MKLLLITIRILIVFLLVFVSTVPAFAECPPGTAAYWPLNEGSGPLYSDSIGANDLSCLNGCPAAVPGLFATAQDFVAASSDLKFFADQNLEWAVSASFSVEYWFKRSSVNFTGQEAILTRHNTTNNRLTLWSGLGADGKVRVVLTDIDGSGPGESLSGSNVLTDNRWHHVVLLHDAVKNRSRLYVDGLLEGEQSFTYPAALGIASDSLAVGWSLSSSADFYAGLLDELAIYSRPLSSFEITQHKTDGQIGLGAGFCSVDSMVRILPLGDSVTAGYNSINWDTDYMLGYRQKLYLDLTALGYQVDFVGSGSSGELNPPAFDFDHEGHGGWTATMIADNVFSWLQVNPADIVLLHVGTNFISSDPVNVARILDEIDSYSTDVIVVLAKIINKKTPDPEFTQFNQNLEAMANARILAGDKILIVDQENALIYPDNMDDELHPLQSGYEKMADVWREALEKLLPVPAFTPPVMISSPIPLTTLNHPYVYQARASGMPPATYSLVEFPAGMSINETSGLVEWTPLANGQYPVSIEARNAAGSVLQSFLLTVSETLILDTGDSGTSSTGSWEESGGIDPYGSLSLWSRDLNANYTFEGSLSGPHAVSLWWTEWPSRCSSVPVEIYDGSLLLTRLLVNQQTSGGQWNEQGVYNFTGTARVVINSEYTDCSTNADAVRFVPTPEPALDSLVIEGPLSVNKNSTATYVVRAFYVDGHSQPVVADSWSENSAAAEISALGVLTTLDVSSDQPCRVTATYSENAVTRSVDLTLTILNSTAFIFDTGDPGTFFSGSWAESNGPDSYETLSLWSRDVGGQYSYEAALSDTYQVALWWTEWSSRCVAVPIEIYDGAKLLDRVLVNQQNSGGQWNPLGTYTFSGLARVSILSVDSACSTNADAVQFTPGVKPALDYIAIEGPASVNKNSTAGYTARAYYLDGSSQLVSPDSWAEDSIFAGISQTGILTTLDVSSDQPCQLTASYTENGITRLATFDLVILSSALVILDTGDPGTSYAGTWSESGGLDPYESLSLWSRDVGGTYNYQMALSGDYETSIWWTEWSSRCTAVPVEIYDGNLLLDRILVNQQVNGGQWNALGVFSFSGTARVVILSESEGCSTNADAIQFAPGTRATLDYVQIEGPDSVSRNSTAHYQAHAFYVDGSSRLITPDSWLDNSLFAEISPDGTLTTLGVNSDQPCQISLTYTEGAQTRTATFDLIISSADIVILDTGDPGTSFVGVWDESGGANPYGALSLWSREAGASYTFNVPVNGTYQLDLWWTEYPSRCSAIVVEIYADDLLQETVSINQQVNGGQWNTLGQYSPASDLRAVILSESTACSTNADAFRLRPVL